MWPQASLSACKVGASLAAMHKHRLAAPHTTSFHLPLPLSLSLLLLPVLLLVLLAPLLLALARRMAFPLRPRLPVRGSCSCCSTASRPPNLLMLHEFVFFSWFLLLPSVRFRFLSIFPQHHYLYSDYRLTSDQHVYW